MNTLITRGLALLLLAAATTATLTAQVPQMLNYQGRVAVGTTNFDGSGQFKFALVNTDGSTTYWSNDGSSTAGSEPTAAVTLAVTKGLYSVQLGDTTLANMTAVPASVFTNADVRLPDRTYTIQYSTDLSASGWQTLTGATILDNGQTRTITDPDTTSLQKFYRVQVSYP